MRRYSLAFACAALVMFLTPARGEAAIIQCFDPATASCQPIGFFSWDVDIVLGDDIFTIKNASDESGSPATGAFSDVAVTVDSGLGSESVALFGTIAAGDQLNFPTVDPFTLFFSSSQADLSFLFESVRFELLLTGPSVQTPIYATTVAPEPATLLLFTSGTIMVGFIRRRRRH